MELVSNTQKIDIENKLIKYGDEFVLLDSDVAEIYNVETRDINKAVKNKDFVINLKTFVFNGFSFLYIFPLDFKIYGLVQSYNYHHYCCK